MEKRYRMQTSPCAKQKNMVVGDKYRITILTECLIRLK